MHRTSEAGPLSALRQVTDNPRKNTGALNVVILATPAKAGRKTGRRRCGGHTRKASGCCKARGMRAGVGTHAVKK